jgi:hypothetical protein
MTDALTDPRPRFSTESMVRFGGWVAFGVAAYLNLTHEQDLLRAEQRAASAAQDARIAVQEKRLAAVEQGNADIHETLAAICERLQCRKEGMTK